LAGRETDGRSVVLVRLINSNRGTVGLAMTLRLVSGRQGALAGGGTGRGGTPHILLPLMMRLPIAPTAATHTRR